MEPAYHAGDLVVVTGADSYSVGEIVAYEIPAGQPAAGFQVIHRIVGGDAQSGFDMRGDNTNGLDQWHPRSGDVIGRAMLVLPGASSVLLLLRNPLLLGSLAAAFAVAWLMEPVRRGFAGKTEETAGRTGGSSAAHEGTANRAPGRGRGPSLKVPDLAAGPKR
jgi:signal peptidase I